MLLHATIRVHLFWHFTFCEDDLVFDLDGYGRHGILEYITPREVLRENNLPHNNFYIIGSSLRWFLHDIMSCLFLLWYQYWYVRLLFRGLTGT